MPSPTKEINFVCYLSVLQDLFLFSLLSQVSKMNANLAKLSTTNGIYDDEE
jgi:hypothetical protein